MARPKLPPPPFPRVTTFADSVPIRSVAYDPATRRMRVHFVRNDVVWEYRDIPPTEYASVVAAISPGAVFNERIRGRYDAVQILEAEGKREPASKHRRGQLVMLDNYEGK